MARNKNLAGLTALAGLAYMASRDKASKSAAPMGDDQYNPDVKQRAKDMGEIRDDDGTLSKTRINTETGERYTLDKAMATPAATPRAPAKRVMAKAPSAPRDDQYNPDVKQRLKDDQYNPAVKQYRDDTYNPQVKQYRDDTYDPKMRRGMNKENLAATNETFKKGGSVKGWGISRGARKAKNY